MAEKEKSVKIKRGKMKVIIIGCGRVGSELASLLNREGHQVSVVDRDESSFRRLSPNFKGEKIVGLGFDRDVLIQAGIEKADAFVAVTGGDNHNIVSALVALRFFHVPRVIARIFDEERARLYWKMGIPTVAPVTWAVERIKDYIAHSEIRETASFGNADVRLVELDLPLAWEGKSVKEINVPGEMITVAVERKGKAIFPQEGTKLKEGDVLHIAVASDYLVHLEKLLKGF